MDIEVLIATVPVIAGLASIIPFIVSFVRFMKSREIDPHVMTVNDLRRNLVGWDPPEQKYARQRGRA